MKLGESVQHPAITGISMRSRGVSACRKYETRDEREYETRDKRK